MTRLTKETPLRRSPRIAEKRKYIEHSEEIIYKYILDLCKDNNYEKLDQLMSNSYKCFNRKQFLIFGIYAGANESEECERVMEKYFNKLNSEQ